MMGARHLLYLAEHLERCDLVKVSSPNQGVRLLALCFAATVRVSKLGLAGLGVVGLKGFQQAAHCTFPHWFVVVGTHCLHIATNQQ